MMNGRLWIRRMQLPLRWALIGTLILLSGCTSVTQPLVSLAPPDWIQGIWYDAFKFSSFTFTQDNVIFCKHETPGDPEEWCFDFREQFAKQGLTDRIYGERWPTYELISRGSTVVKFVLWTKEVAPFGHEFLEVQGTWADLPNYYREK
jgi:hypothetical protein